MSIITLYALFGDDIRVVTTSKDSDSIFWGLSSFSLVAFSIEIILCSISQVLISIQFLISSLFIMKPGYFLGFFFWLDIMSTFSLILDIGWISNLIFQQSSGGKGSSSVASLAKASRASRVGNFLGQLTLGTDNDCYKGTRAGRIVRVVRLVRLVRLYKHAQQTF